MNIHHKIVFYKLSAYYRYGSPCANRLYSITGIGFHYFGNIKQKYTATISYSDDMHDQVSFTSTIIKRPKCIVIDTNPCGEIYLTDYPMNILYSKIK